MSGRLDELVALSRGFGSRPGFALAGGGNTSLKTADRLWVKASGHRLAAIDASGFVELDRGKLEAMLDAADWPEEPAAREALFVERVMAARVDPAAGRPSVEALLHHLLPERFVVHTHPTAVNALACCVRGGALAEEHLGPSALWQPYADPGLTLALDLRARLGGGRGGVVLMENHGLIVSGADAEAIEDATSSLLRDLPAADAAGFGGDPLPADRRTLAEIAATVRGLAADRAVVPFETLAVRGLVATTGGRAAALAGPLTPDQIVYCGGFPAFVEAGGSLGAAVAAGPRIVLIAGRGGLAIHATKKQAATAAAVYDDAAQVMLAAHALGGVKTMTPAHRVFIEQWEAESHRQQVAADA
ncbi:class II aldolase/adducin family protein [Phycisphaera mikurensis]|uniref:Class II aldolase/adducin N-terminal domain-containing protein n=1 Tax=Phycisphaera mikurensis (strain NBRC 102666 / KCTC 22515 / FYK2301M01) TaxID=1142394 RepID=I0IEJ1_PHYMF|nr:class II aldolase/adducin family protein [Phycisphaera mikurensis]MBB6441478.1 rhamnose utilization protein RhaD (predicted bifunctional aldolase and dehydrogenase) [Phycisphaera mikurensis]BAM03679.1 hypothetical protein PSMK_15200 [Phycisphaera mikurensis NBRC 102666]